eukprot:Awhi_evm1s7692
MYYHHRHGESGEAINSPNMTNESLGNYYGETLVNGSQIANNALNSFDIYNQTYPSPQLNYGYPNNNQIYSPNTMYNPDTTTATTTATIPETIEQRVGLPYYDWSSRNISDFGDVRWSTDSATSLPPIYGQPIYGQRIEMEGNRHTSGYENRLYGNESVDLNYNNTFGTMGISNITEEKRLAYSGSQVGMSDNNNGFGGGLGYGGSFGG